MKSKGAIQIFTVALTLACLFYMSFSFLTWNVEKDAEDFANGDVEKENRYLDSMLSQNVLNLGIAEFTYADARKQKLNLGLDLQGGMHVTLEVALDRLIKNLSGNPADPTLNKALQRANELQKTSQDDYVDLFYKAYQEVAEGSSLFRAFDTRDNRGKFDRQAADKDLEVVNYIKSEAEQAVERTTDILRTRIDAFGVTQPTIRQEGSGRITIELPGVDDTERVRTLLQQSAKLEFWETYEANVIIGKHFTGVNEVLVDLLGLSDNDSTETEGDSPADFFGENDQDSTLEKELELAQDSTPKTDTVKDDNFEDFFNTASSDSDTSATAGDTTGNAARENFTKKFPLYAKLQPAVDQNGQIQRGPVVGYASKRDTGIINKYLGIGNDSNSYKEVKAMLPADVKFLWEVKAIDEAGTVFRLVALRTAADGEAPLTGSVITDATQNYDMISGKPEVNMKMNSSGAQTWKKLTEANIDKSIAISLDNKIYSFPVVNGVIPNGSSVIQGNFTIEEAQDLASVLKAGKLPVTVDIVEEATVGPTLGQESINNGLMSLLIGFAMVLLFMGFYYRKSGWVANIALLANLFFIVGILASLGAALTLPGMAGIVLTIGMSVDANVLIFERIREELKNGKGVKQAIADGYKHAYSSIIDANVTTLLTAAILLLFGKGPISGFAIILVIGIFTSLFCAIFITRLMFETMLKREAQISFGTEKSMNLFTNFNWNFMAKRKIAYIISGLIIVAGAASLTFKGLNLSVDFEGGRSYVVRYDGEVSTTVVGDRLDNVFGSRPVVKTFGAANVHKITTKYRIDDNEEGVDQEVQDKLEEGLASALADGEYAGVSYQIDEGKKVGPTFARDIKVSAIQSVIVGLIGIFLYIVLRFRRWQFGLGALLALFHDVLFVLGLFSIFWNVLPINLEVDQAFIAAILTIVGYSINDTVVVFDRVRENLQIHTKAPLMETINGALNKTVSRTLITSVTTLLVVLVLFIFGGEIIRGFSFALLIGILVGTYSSLFIATPVVVDFNKKKLPAGE